MYSPSLHLKTMPKSSFVIDKETTSALFISLTRDTECYTGMLPSVAFILMMNFLFLDLYSI